MMLTGMTVGELIEKLRSFPPETLVVTAAGEATITTISQVEDGFAYKFKDTPAYGMSSYLHCRQESDLRTLSAAAQKSAVPAILVS